MSGKIIRYQQQQLVEHLAHQYVLGTQSLLVRRRIAKLRQQYPAIDDRIYFWEQKLTVLHDQTPELAPKVDNWQAIQQKLALAPKRDTHWFGVKFYQWLSGLSMACLAMIFVVWWQTVPQDNLSYIAVMEDQLQQPQLIAATYGDSRTLKIELLSEPQVAQEMSLELWVRSKTDRQLRSLGVISTASKVFDRQLTEAEWRLIKDSKDLLLTLEEKGGSPIGEPMGEIMAQGLCIRMASWQDKV